MENKDNIDGKTPLLVRIDSRIVDKATQEAQAKNRSRSNLIECILAERYGLLEGALGPYEQQGEAA